MTTMTDGSLSYNGTTYRHEGDDVTKQRMLAVRYMHRDGQGGR
jgi:hypothetical protein